LLTKMLHVSSPVQFPGLAGCERRLHLTTS
jgi:hypothetical protein